MKGSLFRGISAFALSCALAFVASPALAEPMEAEESTGSTATELVETENAALVAAEEEVEAAAYGDIPAEYTLHAEGHVQNKGWVKETNGITPRYNTIMAGSTGEGLRMEALHLWIDGTDEPIQGRAHVQDVGWMDWTDVTKTKELGTTSRGLRIESLRLKLPESLAAAGYKLSYRLHVENIGWLGWADDGNVAGTAGYGLRVEAIELYLSAPGELAPAIGSACYSEPWFTGQGHVENIGWQPVSCSEEVGSINIGTTGQSLRVEAIKLNRPSIDFTGDIIYEAHVENIGWQGERKNGALAGTSGQALRLEAIKIRLTEELSAKYDVYYRVHAQDIGWMNWAKNDEKAGTQGFGRRLEAIEICFAPKGQTPLPPKDLATDAAFLVA